MSKKLADLTIDDLERHAVWRVEDRDGVEMAEPVELTDIPQDPDDMLIARTRFRLANGHVHLGWSTPGDWGAADFVPPVIIHGGRALPLCDEQNGPVAYWPGLAASPKQVFPVTLEPDVTVDGKRVTRRYDRNGRDPDAKRPGFWSKVLGVFDDVAGGH